MGINETLMTLVQNAEFGPRPTRQRAQTLIRAAIVDNPDLMETLAPVYRYLMPQNRRRPRNAFEWVAQAAAGKKDRREELRFVYVENSTMVATDGYRLHIAKNDKHLPNGYYHPKTGDRIHFTSWHLYPDWNRVVPSIEEGFFTRLAFNDMVYDAESYEKDGIIVAIPHWMEGSGYGINLRYIEDALNNIKFSGLVYQQAHAPESPLVMLSDYGRAVVMPIRLPRRNG